MIPVKCESPPCKSSLLNFRKTFYVENLAESPCPSCGLSGHLVSCATIHLIKPERFGVLESRQDGRRYAFLCADANRLFRAPLATPGFPHAYTTVVSACTCEQCLLSYGAQELNGELLVR